MGALDLEGALSEKLARAKRKEIKSTFSGRINGNFLLRMLDLVLTHMLLADEIGKYFDWLPNQRNMFSGTIERVDYEVCRYIIGAHRSNTIFLDDAERSKKESDPEYQQSLKEQVLTNIRLRGFAGAFFRNKQIISGDEFLFFNLPHDLFAISMNAHYNMAKVKDYQGLYLPIFTKAIAALTLLEDNLIDESFGICRAIIELYAKMLLLMNRPEAKEDFWKFQEYDVVKNVSSRKLPKDFYDRYNTRKYQKRVTMSDYLHYGFVDSISDYISAVKGVNPYSISGLLTFLSKQYPENDGTSFEWLRNFYSFCNGYAHGNTLKCCYPLNDYFHEVYILSIVLEHTYRIFCGEANIPTDINGIDIVKKTNEDFKELQEKYNERNEEKFEAYYKRVS